MEMGKSGDTYNDNNNDKDSKITRTSLFVYFRPSFNSQIRLILFFSFHSKTSPRGIF